MRLALNLFDSINPPVNHHKKYQNMQYIYITAIAIPWYPAYYTTDGWLQKGGRSNMGETYGK